jgi:peroxiredoxin
MSQIEVNKPAPDFSLADFNGKQVSLSDYRDMKNVLLVLNRGLIWTFCQKHLAQLRRDHDRFTEMDTVIISIGPDDSEKFIKYWEKNDIPFVGLPDENHSVLKLYGQKVNLFKLGRQPAQMLIDKKGMLRFIHYGHSMSDIPSNEEMLKLIENL